MRLWSSLLLVALCHGGTPAFAADAPYYGPMKSWGIGGLGSEGYRERTEPDGSWRVEAATRGRDATEMALYRAAERAHDEGYAYVEMLGGHASQAPGRARATLYARPSRTPTPPATCWRKNKPKSCYTADVADVLRRLSGPDGSRPGVSRPSETDEYGRQVSYGGIDFGFGVGAVSRMPPASPPRSPAPSVSPAPQARPASPWGPVARPAPATHHPTASGALALRTPGTRDQETAERFAQALSQVRPVNRDPRQGWTIGD